MTALLHHPFAGAAWLGAAVWATLAASGAYVGILTAVSPIIATVAGVYLAWKLRQVHTLVNDHASTQEARIGQLVDALAAAGIDIPATTPKTGPS